MHAVEELLDPKDEPQEVKKPQEKEQRVVETTHAGPSSREVDRLLLDARESVGSPTSQHRHRRSLERYIGYMDLMRKGIEIEPSSFEE